MLRIAGGLRSLFFFRVFLRLRVEVAEAFFHLLGCPVHRQQQAEYKLVSEINDEDVKKDPEHLM